MAERLSAHRRMTSSRRVGLATLTVAVLLVHGCITGHLAQRMADITSAAAMPPRIEVAYVRELELAPPPVVAAPVAVPATPRVQRPAPAASAPRDAVARAPTALAAPDPVPHPPAVSDPDPAPESAPASAPALPGPVLAAASAPAAAPAEPAIAAAAVAASAPEAAASAAEPFDWPASTRLSYKLHGNVRGEVHGDAQVEWVRSGTRYQVHLDVTVGLPIAPLMTRRMSSDGELTPQGLAPRRYDEDTKVAFRARRRLTMVFGPDVVVLPDGRRHERRPGLQDTASQFVQLTWLFTLQPGLLRPGGTVEVPLALPRSVDRWIYDVVAEEPVYTSFGAVEAFHLKPRRVSRPGGELSVEIWFAPRLRYLPVRIRIQQDADTFVDLVLARRPELAGP